MSSGGEIGPFDRDGASRVTDIIKGFRWKEQYKKIRKEINARLREVFDTLPTIVPVIEPKLVTLRIASLQIILDTFRDRLGKNYNDVIRAAGEDVGTSFGHDLMKTLRKFNAIPRKREALLEVWSLFDSSADWGRIRVEDFNENKDEFEIKLEGSFLLTGYEKEEHRHCAFMEGYIKGVLNQLFFEYPRWFKEIFNVAPSLLKCTHVKEISDECKHTVCVFAVKLKAEELVQSRDNLWLSFKALDSENYNEAIRIARNTMEFAVKEKLGIPIGERLSFFRSLKAFSKVGISLSLSEPALRRYDYASQIIHGSRTSSKTEAYETIFFLKKFIDEIEDTQLEDLNKKTIIELAKPPVTDQSELSADPIGVLILKIDKLQRFIEEFRAEDKESHNAILKQTLDIKDLCIKYAQLWPQKVSEIIRSERQELEKILFDVIELSKVQDPETSQKAQGWYNKLIRGLDVTADIAQLVSFIAGIPSLPAFLGSQTAVHATEFIRNILSRLRKSI